MTTTAPVQEPAHPADPSVALPGRAHFPCFDGLRAIAAMMVLLHHVGYSTAYGINGRFGEYLAHGDAGVPIFFLISGFLLYRPFVHAHLNGRPPGNVWKFWWNRILRIVPAFWVALFLINWLFGFQNGALAGPRDIITYFGFLQIYDTRRYFAAVNQAWSLGTEMSFYLFLPLFAFVVYQWAKRSSASKLRVQATALVSLFVAGYIWRISLWTFSAYKYNGHGAAPWANLGTEYWLPAFFDLFAMGMGLALLSVWAQQQQAVPRFIDFLGRHTWLWWGCAAFFYWFVSTQLHLHRDLTQLTPSQALARQFLYGLVALFLLIPAVFGDPDTGGVRRFLRWGPVAYFGLVSYAVYLWHQAWIAKVISWLGYSPVFFSGGKIGVLEVAGLTILFATLTATASYFVVEKPVLRLKNVSWFR
jgi:peptidoglycan/LPS O-acetylase OafA/YrhL